MSFEEIMQEHIKALNENTKAIQAYTQALNASEKVADVEHTKESAYRFCGVSYKTFNRYVIDGSIIPCRRTSGSREFFRERDLVALCESKQLYGGQYGNMKSDPRSRYYGR